MLFFKKYKLIVLLTVFATSFYGCGSHGENSVVLITPSPVNEIEKQIGEFNKIYPDIRVETLYMGVGELTTRIKAETENPQTDVASDIPLQYIIQNPELFRSHVSKYDEAFPNDKKDTANYKWYGHYRAPQVFIVNTDILPNAKNEIKGWQDLKNPEYSGEIIMANPGLSSSAFSQLHVMVTVGGWELVEGVLQNAVITPSSRLAYQGVAAGEYGIGMLTEHIAIKLVEEGYPVTVIYPEEGVNDQMTGLAMVENSPNSTNAELLFEFLNSRESHEIAASKPFYRRSTRPDVVLHENLVPTADIDFVLPATEIMNLDGEEYTAMLQKFDEFMADL